MYLKYKNTVFRKEISISWKHKYDIDQNLNVTKMKQLSC